MSACAYCGLYNETLVYCETSGKWFCNNFGKNLGGRSHIVEHVQRKGGKALCRVNATLSNAFLSTKIECFKTSCNNCNIFNLGVLHHGLNGPLKFSCRRHVSGTQRSRWRPLVMPSFRLLPEISGSSPLPQQLDVTKKKVRDIERALSPEAAADEDAAEMAENRASLPQERPLQYADKKQYTKVYRALIKLEQRAEKNEMKKRDREVNVSVTWKQTGNDQVQIEAIFRLQNMIQGHRLSPGNKITLSRQNWKSEATVVRIERNQHVVAMLKLNNKTPIAFTSGFEVAWTTNHVPYERMLKAQDAFETNDMLSQLVLKAVLGHNVNEEHYFDYPDLENVDLSVAGLPNLNPTQDEAARHALTNIVSVIEAPPGTGKTTLATTLACHLVENEAAPVLLCAKSNIAVDKLASMLLKTHLSGIVRLYARWKEDDPDYRPFDEAVENIALHELEKTRKNQRRILEKAPVILCTCIGAGDARLRNIQFKTVIIDECSQCSEMECLVPIVCGRAQQVIMIGDRRQLGPLMKSRRGRKGNFGVSMFERMGQVHGTKSLGVQYRMHPAISEFPNRQFYDGQIVDGVSAEERTLLSASSTIFPNPLLPRVLLSSKNRPEEISATATSYLNHYECQLAHAILHRLFAAAIKPPQIGIICMYEGQREYLAEYLLKISGDLENEDGFVEVPRPSRVGWRPLGDSGFYDKIFGEVEVTTADGFQGREADFILISCVRSNEQGKIGFLSDPRRINVALTRARCGLFILGDPSTLEKNELWKKLIESYRETGCFVDNFLDNTDHELSPNSESDSD